MKISKQFICLGCIVMVIGMFSCKKYLDKAPGAGLSDKDVFSTFNSFQGYVETMYDDIIERVHGLKDYARFNFGDDIIPTSPNYYTRGDYMGIVSSNNTRFYNTNARRGGGDRQAANNGEVIKAQAIWQNSWFGIRAANTTLAHLKDLIVATDEQKKFIEGQAYFFRGYFHWELIKSWGAVPYIDAVVSPSDEMRIPVLGLYETLDKAAADLQRAADLLPIDWDQTVTGQPTFGINIGRATKGMALSLEAECYLFAASPLFNGTATGNYSYNVDYCKKAAAAAGEVIKLADQGVYALEPWVTYSKMFFTKDNTIPRSKEIIFKPQSRGDCKSYTGSFTFGDIGTDKFFDSPTENYAKLFETANGLPVNDPESGFDPMHPWDNRDPRFRYNFLVDKDRRVASLNDDRAFCQLYIGGRDRGGFNSLTGFGFRKYWDETINNIDKGWNKYIYEVPKLRLAEIYLIYAEMANEAYGPGGKAPGANLSAVDAVNIVRSRAQMPDVNQKFLGSTSDFRARIWDERAVELAFESKRWYDIRRWHVAALPQYKELTGLEFDKDHTYFKEVVVTTVQFTEKNYWLPFPVAQVSLYPEWKQNPGW